MKSITLFLIMCLLSIGSLRADDENQNSGSVSSTSLIIKKEPNKRPNAPARYTIGCEYGNGILKFTLPPFVSWIEVEIEQDETIVFQTVVQSSFPSTAIPQLSGECTIRCITDAGAVYEGSINL